MNILRVNMTSQTISRKPLADELRYLGGRALVAKILHKEVDPKCDPLGPHNKLIIAVGPLAGTIAPHFGRISIGGLSPLTKGIKESNAGGPIAQELDKLNYRAIVLEGSPDGDSSFILKISQNNCELVEAGDLQGRKIYATADQIFKRFGEDVNIILIGPGGQKKYKSASIALTDMEGDPSREAARGGLGAVMGSKGIKAIVIDSSEAPRVEIKDRQLFRSAVNEWINLINHDVTCRLFSTFGTSLTVANDSYQGMMASNNYTSGQHEDFRQVTGEVIRKNMWERGGRMHGCMPGCVVKCSQIYNDENGERLVSAFEFEGVSMLGTNLGFCDPDKIAELKHWFDDYGLDFIEVGSSIASAASAGEMTFGDYQRVKELLQEIEDGSDLGRVMADGVVETCKFLNISRVPAVKGQAIPAHDPRGKKGTGVTYLTNPMGADHTAGLTYKTPIKAEGQVYNSLRAQLKAVTCDSFGYCLNAVPGGQASIYAFFARLLSARFGEEISASEVLEIGKQTLRDELNFNQHAGLKDEDSSAFFFDEPLPPTGSVFDVDQTQMANIWNMMESFQEKPKVWEVRFPKLPQIIFGIGAFYKIGSQTRKLGINKPLIVCDHGIAQLGLPNTIVELLGKSHIEACIFDGVQADPPVEVINNGAEVFIENQCDGVIAIGGGSSMDSAKAIAVKATQPGILTEYENMVGGKAKIKPPLPPIICIPTSAGTGSETNQFAVISDVERKLKFTLMSDHMIPTLSIIDPGLTITLPPSITASTGIDALAHCIEGYVGMASEYHPYYEALALYGVKLIGRSLIKAYENGENIEARRDLSMAAAFGGISFIKGLGLGHAVGHAIGAYHHIAHGSSCALGLLIFVRANKVKCKTQFEDLAWALGRTDNLEEALVNLYEKMNMPLRIRDLGIPNDALDEIAYETYINAVNLAANPTPLNENKVLKLIQEAY